ncbi:aquaporin-7-like isoform X2 [Ornithodoros turicata]|uniref:aquaporin-7-like isoform X2 n=1 Tax=Ornithodoros turicata TaxID=34597 RepID=UPI003138F863
MRVRSIFVRELINEFLGTFTLIVFGESIMAIIIAGRQEHNAGIIAPVGWGAAIFCAVTVSGGVSAHLNPAVTLALASVKKFPIKKVPLFFVAQYTGAFLGAAVVFAIYRDAIAAMDNGVRAVTGPTGTAPIFATYPREGISTLTCFIDQVVATGFLVLTAEAITDPRNFGGLPKPFYPLTLGFMITAEIFAFSYNCMAPLNPARDLGPRVFTAIAGYGTGVFSVRNYVWMFVPIFAPHVGGVLGAWTYKVCVEDNWPEEENTVVLPVTTAGAPVDSIVAREQMMYEKQQQLQQPTMQASQPLAR